MYATITQKRKENDKCMAFPRCIILVQFFNLTND